VLYQLNTDLSHFYPSSHSGSTVSKPQLKLILNPNVFVTQFRV